MRKIPLLILLLWSAPVMAGPFTVSSPNSTSAKKVKISGELKDGPGKSTLTLPKIELATAITDRLDLAVKVPYKTVDPKGAGSRHGVGDVEIKSKWHFLQAGRWGFAIEPEVKLPTGDDDRGLGEGDVTLKLPFIVGYKVEAWTFGTELGYERVLHDHDESAYWGVLAMRNLTPSLKVGAELVAESPDARLSRFETVANVGLKWKLPGNFEVQALAGRTVKTPGDGPTRKYKLELEKKF